MNNDTPVHVVLKVYVFRYIVGNYCIPKRVEKQLGVAANLTLTHIYRNNSFRSVCLYPIDTLAQTAEAAEGTLDGSLNVLRAALTFRVNQVELLSLALCVLSFAESYEQFFCFNCSL